MIEQIYDNALLSAAAYAKWDGSISGIKGSENLKLGQDFNTL
jgi:hypothetical protein